MTHFDDIGLDHGPTFNYTITPEGVLSFVTRTEGNLTRFVVTPKSSIEQLLATAKPASLL